MSTYLVQLHRGSRQAGRTPGVPGVPRPENQALGQVANALGRSLQAKLTLGAPEDAREREADAVAERVMRMPDHPSAGGETLRRKCDACLGEDDARVRRLPQPEQEDEEKVQAKANGASTDSGSVATDTASRIQARRGGGTPLPASERAFFEPRFGADFSRVRLHTDAEDGRLAGQLAARAFTVGSDVFLGPGEYHPGTASSRQLIAHELTHVLQAARDGAQSPVRRKIDKVSYTANTVNVHLSIGLYGSQATPALASRWKGDLENQWSRKLKFNGREIDGKLHATVTAYPALPDSWVSGAMVAESNAVFVESAGYRSIVERDCPWKDDWSCGRWAVDAQPLVVAHEAGHLMGLEDQYVELFGITFDKYGYDKDIMANFWNDNGQTDFSRAWAGVLVYYYLGMRS